MTPKRVFKTLAAQDYVKEGLALPDKPSSPKQKYQTTQAIQGQGND
ncbi:hypothetical protein [Thiomicrospira microaerophila]|nr:hypothetical protein [Thiomicrospira microaerophila]